MRRALLLTACTAGFATSAHATQDFCAVVRKTPDGFLALREGPGTWFPMKARLHQGDLLFADAKMHGRPPGHLRREDEVDIRRLSASPRRQAGRGKALHTGLGRPANLHKSFPARATRDDEKAAPRPAR
jgi:hypothetical protein